MNAIINNRPDMRCNFEKSNSTPNLQAIWALGNVPTQCSDYVPRCGALMPLFAQQNEHTTLSMPMSNFCRGQPLPAFGQVFLLLSFGQALFPQFVYFNIWSMINRCSFLSLHLNYLFIRMMKKAWKMIAWHFGIGLMIQKMKSSVCSRLVLSED